MFHRFVFNLKRILDKGIGLGGRLGTFVIGLLIREDKNYLIHIKI